MCVLTSYITLLWAPGDIRILGIERTIINLNANVCCRARSRKTLPECWGDAIGMRLLKPPLQMPSDERSMDLLASVIKDVGRLLC
jgi:hypothetical protein